MVPSTTRIRVAVGRRSTRLRSLTPSDARGAVRYRGGRAGPGENHEDEQRDHEQARADGGEIERADRGLGDQAVDDEGDAGRDQVAERATEPIVAAVATEDPEIAENTPQAAMLVWRRPPGSRSSQMLSAL